MMLLLGFIASVAINAQMTPMMDNQMMMNYLMMSKMSDDTSMMKKMMLMSPGLFGQDPTQAGQMNQLLPLILMGDDDDSDAEHDDYHPLAEGTRVRGNYRAAEQFGGRENWYEGKINKVFVLPQRLN